MSEESNVEFEYCKELAMPPGSLFEASSRFLDKNSAYQLMALYALRQSISDIPLRAVDDTVKWAKLKWWSEELTAAPSEAARHPVLRALYRSGAREKISDQSLTRLVSDAIMQVDVYPDSDRQTLFDRLADLGETDILLELALSGSSLDDESRRLMALATGLHGFISMLLNNQTQKVEQIPLDMLAEFRVSAADLKARPPCPEMIAIITQLARQGLAAFQAGWAAQSSQDLQQLPLHLKLRWHLEERRLKRLVNNTGRYIRHRSAYGLSDVWFAWRFCRQN